MSHPPAWDAVAPRAGSPNLGNTCYFNTALHLLAFTPALEAVNPAPGGHKDAVQAEALRLLGGAVATLRAGTGLPPAAALALLRACERARWVEPGHPQDDASTVLLHALGAAGDAPGGRWPLDRWQDGQPGQGLLHLRWASAAHAGQLSLQGLVAGLRGAAAAPEVLLLRLVREEAAPGGQTRVRNTPVLANPCLTFAGHRYALAAAGLKSGPPLGGHWTAWVSPRAGATAGTALSDSHAAPAGPADLAALALQGVVFVYVR